MHAKNFSLALFVLLAGQGAYAQQSFELPQAPSTLTAPQAAATPKLKKKLKKSTFYTGKVKITSCNDKEAVGIDLATGKTVVVTPRFHGVVVGGVFRFDRNRILQNDTVIVIAPEPGKEDYSPYVASPNTIQELGGAAGAAIQTGGAILNLLNSFR